MWNGSNAEAVRKYLATGKTPFDGDYGAYVAREFLALGYKVQQVKLANIMAFVFTVDLFEGRCREGVICKSSDVPLNRNTVQTLASARAVAKADKYVLVTNATLDVQAQKFVDANRIAVVDEFRMGDEVLNIIDKGGLVPQKLLMLFAQSMAQAAEMEQRLQAADETARLSEARMLHAEALAQQASSRGPRPAAKANSPMDRYLAGQMDPLMGKALTTVARTDAISTASLARKLRIPQDRAAMMLNDMEALGVVTEAEAGRPRFVRMTQAVIERTFGVKVDNQDFL